jgi:transcriptional regulator with XRE-family HTH domain
MREKPTRIASKLKTIRQRLGVSQTGMKQLLNFDGHYGRISEFELGKRIPSTMVLLAYARAAGIALEEIIDDELELSN